RPYDTLLSSAELQTTTSPIPGRRQKTLYPSPSRPMSPLRKSRTLCCAQATRRQDRTTSRYVCSERHGPLYAATSNACIKGACPLAITSEVQGGRSGHDRKA